MLLDAGFEQVVGVDALGAADDLVVDLGGERVMALRWPNTSGLLSGTLDEISANPASHTGRYLAAVLAQKTNLLSS